MSGLDKFTEATPLAIEKWALSVGIKIEFNMSNTPRWSAWYGEKSLTEQYAMFGQGGFEYGDTRERAIKAVCKRYLIAVPLVFRKVDCTNEITVEKAHAIGLNYFEGKICVRCGAIRRYMAKNRCVKCHSRRNDENSKNRRKRMAAEKADDLRQILDSHTGKVANLPWDGSRSLKDGKI